MRATPRKLASRTVVQTDASNQCFARSAQKVTSCRGSEVYSRSIDSESSALPVLSASKGFRKHKSLFKRTQVDARQVAEAGGR